jgi:lipid A ethanolaminephosphotransferase
LGENNIFLHGFPYYIAPKEQKEIPFFIWSSFKIDVKNQDIYIHKNIMPTILKLLEAKTSNVDEKLNILE